MKRNNFAIFLILALLPTSLFGQESVDSDINADPTRFSSYAQIQVLNKTTAKSSNLEVKVGNKIRFSSLDIAVRKCWQAPLDQRPESKILIDVAEINVDKDSGKEKENRIFYGWIFASSPSLSGVEHPIYDIVAISCKSK